MIETDILENILTDIEVERGTKTEAERKTGRETTMAMSEDGIALVVVFLKEAASRPI